MDIIEKLLRKWRERERGDDKADAFIDAVLPEVAEWFVGLFQNEDKNSLFVKLNDFILGAYIMAPDFIQFLARYMANVGLERLQRRWPKWASTPVLIFIKSYFDALEKVSKDKPKPTASELRARLDALASEAMNAASELGKKFTAAWEAAKKIKKPEHEHDSPKEGPDMADPKHAPKGPDAGGTGKKGDGSKKSVADRLSEFSAGFGAAWSAIKMVADRGEDHAQSAANGLFWAVMALLATVLTTTVAAFLDNSRLMVVNVVWWSGVWVVGPFVALWAWRDRNRRIHAAEMSRKPEDERNPYEKTGNGFLELGALGGAAAFVGLVSTLVVAAVCALAAYTHFHAGYVWGGLAAIGAAFFGWTFTDVGLDTFRAIAQAVIPDEREGEALKARNRAARSFSLMGIIYGFLMTGPVLAYVVAYTDYMGSAFVLGIFLALVAGFANTRLGSEASVAAAENVKEIHAEFTKRNYRTALRMLLFAAIPSVIFLGIDNFVLPPACPTSGHIALTCPDKLPSYAERWQKSGPSKLLGAVGDRADKEAKEVAAEIAKDKADDESDESSAVETTTTAKSCDAKIVAFVKALPKRDTCKGVLASTDEQMIGLCEQAIACGALNEDGTKRGSSQKSRPAQRVVGGDEIPWWGWLCGGIAAGVILFLVILGWKEPEKKEEKKGGGGH